MKSLIAIFQNRKSWAEKTTHKNHKPYSRRESFKGAEGLLYNEFVNRSNKENVTEIISHIEQYDLHVLNSATECVRDRAIVNGFLTQSEVSQFNMAFPGRR